MWEELQQDVWLPILEPLGSSLGPACAASASWLRAAGAGGDAAFRPLSCARGAPAPGPVPAHPGRQADVARHRRADVGGFGWRELAQVAASPSSAPAAWRSVQLEGTKPSHRHSVAVCGALQHCGGEGAVVEAALLFGGNVSRTVAGNWRTSDELILAKLPGSITGACEMVPLNKPPTAPWPCSRWGASLTALAPARYLLGGWSHEGDASGAWALRMREAAPEWSRLPADHPPATAFHTATALEDGKRLALVGGLGDGGSQKGLWIFNSETETWSSASSSGPSCAGHAAGAAGGRLAVCGGVRRGRGLLGDDFSGGTSLFDLRAGRWDTASAVSSGPIPRRNPTYATIGRHLLISGGWDDGSSRSLRDAWALDVPRGVWKEFHDVDGPALEGHKAVVSGFDVFCFGGHSGPGTYPSRRLAVHALSLGLGGGRAPEGPLAGEGSEEPEDEHSGQESSSSSEDDMAGPFVRLPDGELVPLRLIRAMLARDAAIRRRMQQASDAQEAGSEPPGEGSEPPEAPS